MLAMTRYGISCHREGAVRPWRSSECDMCRVVTNVLLLGSWGQNAPHKNIRFCGDPAPQDDKKRIMMRPPLTGDFFTGCGGWVHGTARFLLPSLSMHCKTFVPVQIQELILCHIRILIISVRVCAAFLPHRFVLFLRFCGCGAVFDRCMNCRPVSFFLSTVLLG